MLRWLLVLAMALLPWHGWAGASMPAASPAQVHHAAHAAAELPVVVQEAGHGHADADCLGHADAAADHHAAVSLDDGCPGCSMCHSCSPVALPGMPGMPQADATAAPQPATSVSRFASADRDAGLKPPIS